MESLLLKLKDFTKKNKLKKEIGYTTYMVWQMFLKFFFAFFIIAIISSVLFFSYLLTELESPALYTQDFDTNRLESISKNLLKIENTIKTRTGEVVTPTSQN